MSIICIVGLVLALVFIALFAYSLCVVAGRVDDMEERLRGIRRS